MLFVRQSGVSDFEPVVLTFSQCVDILSNLGDMQRVLVFDGCGDRPSHQRDRSAALVGH
jgi:hypothetical protein